MQSFTSTFYHLLSNPEYIETLRHDVETAVAEEGWTKAGMDKMIKVDSFLRESHRISVAGICPLSYSGELQLLMHYCLFSWADPPRLTSVHIFQWCHYSCGYSNRRPGYCYPHGWRNLSKPR
jgi:hypothetical protein